jgi:hypothetical protein
LNATLKGAAAVGAAPLDAGWLELTCMRAGSEDRHPTSTKLAAAKTMMSIDPMRSAVLVLLRFKEPLQVEIHGARTLGDTSPFRERVETLTSLA